MGLPRGGGSLTIGFTLALDFKTLLGGVGLSLGLGGLGVELGLLRGGLGGVGRCLGFGGGSRSFVAFGLEYFLGRLTVDQLVIFRADGVGGDHHLTLFRAERTDARRGGLDQRLGDGRGGTVGLEQRDERFAGLQLGDRRGDIDAGVGAEGLGGCSDPFLVAGGEGAQRVLDAVAELGGDLVGNVDRVLGDEIDADAL